MGQISPSQRPVMLVTAVISSHDKAFDWLRAQAIEEWGPVVLESPKFDFSETKFYTKEMGVNLRKQLLAFETLIDPAAIADIKIQSNDWELAYRTENSHEEARPLNIDPGYITEAKLVLATTKNRDHRIYLQKGIFAEITLFYQGHQWQDSRWTYTDFRRADFKEFFANCRNLLRKRYRDMKTDNG